MPATRHASQSETASRAVSEWEYENEVEAFDPNHHRYLCCCGHAHSMTGMRIVAGMLCVTVLFEVWQLIVTIFAAGHGGIDRYQTMTTAARFLIGAAIAGSVLWAILSQRAEMLIPYLLLQGAGLAVGLVFFVSFLYIALFGDRKVGITVLRSYGGIMAAGKGDDATYLNYAAWLMAGSFAIVIFLQVWLMGIVVACWRYLRDKRALFTTNAEYTPYVVLKPVKKMQLLTEMRLSLSAEALGAASSAKKKRKVNGRSASATLDL
ncbi:unnamed protein product [Caenorhabditis auriculariae]|uniref:Uncharacterized protein n=1 Tax=Caenorhabditis auriculariae TaxID=2777116 RepID=A0A8S1GRF6_9PELO|nr:unnamed protein product [Caenorhabditis auriculariae]